LRRALEACERARTATTNGISAEYVAIDLREGLRAFGQMLGEIDIEDVLDSVFSQFCIGK
jgi:tRNA modification GTPase